MVTRIPSLRSLAAAGAAATVISCSLVLDWSLDGLPCDTAKKCDDGYSCLVNRCVAEGSLLVGDTCSDSVQCQDYPTNICGQNPFVCRKRCQDSYLTSAAGVCDTGEYCRNEADRDKAGAWTGTCIESECTVKADCNDRSETSKQCVAVTPTANACMQTCEVTVTAGVVSNNCGTTGTNPVYCQPIGPKSSPSLVCLSLLTNDTSGLPNTGDPCQLVKNPCQSDAACFGDLTTFCRKYCDTSVNNTNNTNDDCPITASYCCGQPVGANPPLYAVCMQDGCN